MPPRPLEAGWRFLAACVLLLAATHAWGQTVIEWLLPLFRIEIGWLEDRYRILGLSLATQGADSVVRLDVNLQRIMVVGSHVIHPDPRGHAHVTTLTGHVLQPAILGLALLAAWPPGVATRMAREYALRLVLGLAMIGIVLAADVPFVLLGELWAIAHERFSPGNFSPLLVWTNFLQGGGRLALGLLAGAAGIAAAAGMVRP
ncbi:MAG: hypothetical protein Q8O52_08320 [Sulfuritalea sp.]|nr:hypothetical protein [Sulfuritalea sp.]